MKLLIPPQIRSEILDSLERVGKREIGGVLMGANLGQDTFRVTKITIQKSGGTFAAFQRMVSEIIAPLKAFFGATGHNYTKWNYLGEWHSHHSFQLVSSGQDDGTMRSMISDPDFGAHFLVLLLVKTNSLKTLEASVTVYRPHAKQYLGEVIQEETFSTQL